MSNRVMWGIIYIQYVMVILQFKLKHIFYSKKCFGHIPCMYFWNLKIAWHLEYTAFLVTSNLYLCSFSAVSVSLLLYNIMALGLISSHNFFQAYIMGDLSVIVMNCVTPIAWIILSEPLRKFVQNGFKIC